MYYNNTYNDIQFRTMNSQKSSHEWSHYEGNAIDKITRCPLRNDSKESSRSEIIYWRSKKKCGRRDRDYFQLSVYVRRTFARRKRELPKNEQRKRQPGKNFPLFRLGKCAAWGKNSIWIIQKDPSAAITARERHPFGRLLKKFIRPIMLKRSPREWRRFRPPFLSPLVRNWSFFYCCFVLFVTFRWRFFRRCTECSKIKILV